MQHRWLGGHGLTAPPAGRQISGRYKQHEQVGRTGSSRNLLARWRQRAESVLLLNTVWNNCIWGWPPRACVLAITPVPSSARLLVDDGWWGGRAGGQQTHTPMAQGL